jgi:thioredoxin reductase
VAKNEVTGLQLKNVDTGVVSSEWPVKALFVAIGHQPNTQALRRVSWTWMTVGYLVTPQHQAPSIPGVFAAGDVQDPSLPPGHHGGRHRLHGRARGRTVYRGVGGLNSRRAFS